MNIVYLPVNQAWVLLHEEQIIRVYNKLFFAKRKHLLRELGFESMKAFEKAAKR